MKSMEHELLLINSFVIKERRERYINLIATEKGREKFKNYISHFKDLNGRYCTAVPYLESCSQLHNILKSEGGGDVCYVISENSKYDMSCLSLKDATTQLFSSGISFFLSCIPGKLVYYEGEEFNQRFILKKNA